MTRHKAHINTKVHKHKTAIRKKVVEIYLQEKCIQILSYNDKYNFLNVPGLFFVRITRIAEKIEREKEEKFKVKEKRKLEKKRKKKREMRAKKTNNNKEKDEEEEENEIYERWDENEEPENEF